MPIPEIPTVRLRGRTEREEQATALEIKAQLDSIPDLIKRHDENYGRTTVPGSKLHADDASTHPIRMTSAIQYCLNMAIDALRALRTLLVQQDGLVFPQTAHYPLIRTVMESSAQAIWLMSPLNQRERVVRLLCIANSEAIHDRRLVDAMAAADPGDTKSNRSDKNEMLRTASKQKRDANNAIRTVAHPFTITIAEYEGASLQYGEMIGAAALAIGAKPSFTRAMWHMASGFTHPSSSRGAMASIIDRSGPDEGDVLQVRMSTDMQVAHGTLLVAFRLYVASDNLYQTGRGLLSAESNSGSPGE